MLAIAVYGDWSLLPTPSFRATSRKRH